MLMIISALGRLRQEDHECGAVYWSMGCLTAGGHTLKKAPDAPFSSISYE